MPKICYIRKNFQEATFKIINQSNIIINKYLSKGLKLTLRQLYYQFVTMGEDYMIELKFPVMNGTPHNEKSYNKLGNIINDARLAGLIDWSAIEDRTRKLLSNTHWNDPGQIIGAACRSFYMDKWRGQEFYVEVWIEKEALSGVIEKICEKLDVGFLACKGYVSQSEMWKAARRLRAYHDTGQTPVIIHLGDHDPSGIDMTRDIEDRQGTFWTPTIVKRIALNMDQVEIYNPPPFWAKAKDSRSNDYVAKYGQECWELDALEPETMTRLIEDTVLSYRDETTYQKVINQEQEYLSILQNIEESWETL